MRMLRLRTPQAAARTTTKALCEVWKEVGGLFCCARGDADEDDEDDEDEEVGGDGE